VTWSRSIDLSAGGEGGNQENYKLSQAGLLRPRRLRAV